MVSQACVEFDRISIDLLLAVPVFPKQSKSMLPRYKSQISAFVRFQRSARRSFNADSLDVRYLANANLHLFRCSLSLPSYGFPACPLRLTWKLFNALAIAPGVGLESMMDVVEGGRQVFVLQREGADEQTCVIVDCEDVFSRLLFARVSLASAQCRT